MILDLPVVSPTCKYMARSEDHLIYILSCMHAGKFRMLLSYVDVFQNKCEKEGKDNTFYKIFLQTYHQSVKPGPTCLEIFSARGTDMQRVLFVCFPF